MSDSSTRFKALFFHLCPQSWAPSRFSINVHWINKTGEEVRKEHLYITSHSDYWGLPSKLSDKESACGAGAIVDTVSICGSGRSSGEVNGNPLQYSCLENSMDRGAWWATVHIVSKSWTWLKLRSRLITINFSVIFWREVNLLNRYWSLFPFCLSLGDGKAFVSFILPFLLLSGFSKTLRGCGLGNIIFVGCFQWSLHCLKECTDMIWS